MRGSLPRAVAPAVLLAVCAVVFVGIIAVGLGAPGRTDFLDLYAGARLVATGQGDRLGDQDAVFAEERAAAPDRVRPLPYVHLPAVAVAMSPLGALPYGIAYPVAMAVASILVAVALALLARPRPVRWRPLIVALASGCVRARSSGRYYPREWSSMAVRRARPRRRDPYAPCRELRSSPSPSPH